MFDDMPIISRYTRAQALADGVLIDVTPTAKEVGFRVSVAITRALHHDIADIPAEMQPITDYEGRLWDVLYRGCGAIKRDMTSADTLVYSVHMPTAANRTAQIKLMIGPGDDGECVITVMLPDES